MKPVRLFLATAFLTACASLPTTVPDANNGPTATIRDSVWSDVVGRGDFFVVAEIDGTPIRTSMDAERAWMTGKGFGVAGVTISRPVPARPVRLTLLGQRVFGAPIQELWHLKDAISVRTVIEFSPTAGAMYYVYGKLDGPKPEIWLQDEARDHVGKVLANK